jgi:cytochrome P450
MTTHTDTAAAAPAATRDIAALPGPRGWPVVGNVFQLDPARIHLTLERWAEQYGPLYVYRFVRHPVLVIADPTLVQHVLRERPHGFRRLRPMDAILRELGVSGVFNAEAADWHRQRRVVMQGFNTAQLKRFFPALVTVTERLRRRWAAAAERGTDVDVAADFMRYTVDVTTNLAFGHDMNTLEREGDVIQRHLEHIFPMISRRLYTPLPYWRWFKLPADRALDRALAAVRQVVVDLIRERRAARTQAARPANFLEAMLAAQAAEGAALSDDEIFGNVFTILLAGEDTTANTMAWMIHFMCEHPEVAARLREEADSVLGASAVAERIEDLERLVYLDAVAAEAMRLKPVAPLLYLETNADTELGGVRLRRGTAVALLPRAAAFDERYFTGAREFRPERWLAGAKCPAHDTRAFVPFGAGPRFCPGRNLALMEIKTAMSMVARHFTLAPPNAARPVGERFAFTMMPTGLHVRLRPRTTDTP